MGHLRGRDIAALLDCVRGLYALAPGGDFRGRCLQALSRIIPSNYVGMHSIDAGKREGDITIYPFGSIAPRDLAGVGRHIYQHPFFAHPAFTEHFVPASAVRSAAMPRIKESFFRRFLNGGVVSVSDALRHHIRQKLALYGEVLGKIGADHSLGILLRCSPSENEVFAFSRGSRDYTARERHMLGFLAPHIMRCMDRPRQSPLSAKEGARASIAVQRCPGLTPREAEVLHWVAQGKSNADIAEILGMATGTVKKHLEHIFPKLGVENRMSAALTAMEAGNR